MTEEQKYGIDQAAVSVRCAIRNATDKRKALEVAVQASQDAEADLATAQRKFHALIRVLVQI